MQLPLSALFPAGLTPFLLLLALAVRFSGRSKILNSVDYQRISDLPAFHRWTGNRLLVLPLLAVVTVFLSVQVPHFAPVIVVLFFFSIFVVSIAVIAGGTSKFSSK